MAKLRKFLPTAAKLRSNRYLKPFARHLDDHALWQFNRRGVAGGAAIGLFFGILVPFMQIFLAAVAAILLRVNLPVAALATLVSNPLTFPPLYYLAYRIGNTMVGAEPDLPEHRIEAEVAYATELLKQDQAGWTAALLDWLSSVGLPLASGLALLACGAALAGYAAVHLLWRLHSWRRWRRRDRRQASRSPTT